MKIPKFVLCETFRVVHVAYAFIDVAREIHPHCLEVCAAVLWWHTYDGACCIIADNETILFPVFHSDAFFFAKRLACIS